MLEVIWIELHMPGVAPVLGGFILLETLSGRAARFTIRMLADWSFLAREDDREVLAGMEDLIRSMLEEDPEGALSSLENASNVVRFSSRLRLQAAAGSPDMVASELARILLDEGGGGLTQCLM